MDSRHALRGAALTFVADPFEVGIDAALRYESDALVVMEAGRITHFGAAADVLPNLSAGTPVRVTGPGTLILPGFIDCHVHYPQTQMIGVVRRAADRLARQVHLRRGAGVRLGGARTRGRESVPA